jgi:hypothetical protein
MRFFARSVFASLLALSALTSLVKAERPTAPKLLPESTLAYARVHDAKDLVAAFQESGIGRMFNDPQVSPFIKDLYSSASDAFGAIEAEVGLPLDDLLAIPQGEMCLALVGADQGQPAVVGIIQVNDNLESAEKLVDRIIGRVENRGGGMESVEVEGTLVTVLKRPNAGRVVIFDREGALVVSNDLDLAKQILGVWSGKAKDVKTFADNPHFTAIMKQCAGIQGERPQITWFVDPISLAQQATRGNFSAAAAMAFLEPLGLNGVRGAGGSLIMRPEAEFETINQFHILLDNPRKGLVKMVAFSEGETTPEKFVPATVASYITINWDLEQTYNEADRILSEIRQEENALDAEVKRRIDDATGIDFKKDVLDQLTGRATLFTWIQKPSRFNSQCTFIGFKVKDEKPLKETLEKITGRFGIELEKKSFGGVEYYRLPIGQQAQDNPNFDEEILRVPEPMIAFFDGYVAYLDSEQLLKEIVKTSRKEGASLASTEDYMEIAGKIEDHTHGELLGMMAFARPEEGLRSIYEIARSDSTKQRLADAGDNPLFTALHRALDKNELPPFDVLAKYFSPTGTIVTNTETGIHWMEFAMKKEDNN